MKEKKGYKDTLNLPRTEFSMKADLPRKEPEIIKKWEKEDIYARIMDKRKDAEKTFILHDGPPYANGHIHMGHVLNKTLKDICVKYFTMKGFRAPYVPGWDCHGLPVEHQLFKELAIGKHQIDQIEFRNKAFDYAMKFVGIQSEEFKRLGVFGDWKKPYLTLAKEYEADILHVLADLCEKGFIYKDFKPVNWCRKCETALAEAEVEYEDKKSPSIYIKFRAEGFASEKGPVYFVVWTTTPWTLLANVAVALHPDFTYSFVNVGGEIWIMVSELAGSLMEKASVSNAGVLREKTGKEIADEIKSARHPFIQRGSAIVLADYITKEEGTGCVHIAPGHGQDDYITGKKYGLPVLMPVDDGGRFTKKAAEFAGLDVIKANSGIIEKMETERTLIISEEITHSYPHCWRCGEPIIFRATEQWFMSMDHGGLREAMIGIIENQVKWVPEIGRERISSMVKGRPDWCLSRQRYWGVPIPAFRCRSCGERFIDAAVVRRVAVLTEEKGANVWFEKNVSELLPEGTVCGKCGKTEFLKEDDILDVWFDSGVSYKAVLEKRDELDFPADLYLEGSDQHRGWFQSALITSVSTKGNAPYRGVLTHGFVVDGGGRKMSKSVGNVIKPRDVMKKYGADILRLWVASSNYDGDIKLSSEILERLADGYRKIRNTFRFLLSNLYDFDYSANAVDPNELQEVDKWVLSRLYGLVEEVNVYYKGWEFYKVYRAVYNFCVYEISAFYLDVSKDVLYVMRSDSTVRRSAQTVIFNMLYTLVRIMAPILVFTAEEVWNNIRLKGKEESIHMSDWPDIEKDMAGWKNKDLDAKWEKILAIRGSVMKFLELKREKGIIRSSLEAAITLYSDDTDMKQFIKENSSLFPGLFKVSQTSVLENARENMEDALDLPLKIGVETASGKKCQRCWNFSDTVGQNKNFSDLCRRCSSILFDNAE